MEARTLLSAVSWTGTAGDNNWDTAGNWSSSPALPGPSDDVTIDVSADVMHSSNITDSIHSLTSSQPLTITGGTLSIATASTISNTLTLAGASPTFTGGTLSGAGDIDVGSLLTLNIGTLGGSGTVTANGGIALQNSTPTGLVLDGKTLVNPVGQTATWTGQSSTLIERNGANFVNNGTFVEQAPFSNLSNQGNTGAAVAFTNNGSFTQSANNGAFVVTGVAFNVNSPGTVDVLSGELDLQGGGTSTGGSYTAEAGDPLDFGAPYTGAALGFSSNYTLDADSSISGSGTVGFGINFAGTVFQAVVNVAIAGSYDVTGTTFLGSAVVNFNGPVSGVGSTLSSAPSPTLILTAALNFNTPFLGSAGVIPSILLHGGIANFGTNSVSATTLTVGTQPNVVKSTVTGTGDITVSGLTTLNEGTLSGSGTVFANGGMTGSDVELIIDGKTVVNSAGQTATFTGDNLIFNERNGAGFVNNGIFVAQFTGAFSDTGNTGAPVSFTNNGTFTVPNGIPGSSFAVPFNSTDSSTVNVLSGALGLQAGGTESGASFALAAGTTVDFSSKQPFVLDAATSFSGAGMIIFDLTQGGLQTLEIPGNSPSFTGPTRLVGGTLLVNGSMPASPVTLFSTGTLGGTGTVGPITSDGTVKPGTATATGILSANGNATLNPSSFFTVAIAGPDPGTGFDQLAASGTVDITDSVLQASLQSFTPAPGQAFPIITSTGPVVGTFHQLPEGAALTISGVPFTISYAGGSSHNNVVLTEASAPTNDHLAVTAQPPGSVTTGSTFSLAVSAVDSSGIVDPTYTGLVVLALASGTGGLGGTTMESAQNGVATFSGLSLSPAGTYSIGATSDDLNPATTNVINVTTPTLVVTGEPPGTVNDFAPFSMEVSAEDGLGHIDTSYTGLVTLALASGTGTLGGTRTVAADNGVALFLGLSLSPAGTYTIGATSDGLVPATTTAVTVLPQVATAVVLTSGPTPDTVAIGSPFSLVATIEDAFGHVVPDYTQDVTVLVEFGPGMLGGTTSLTPTNGVASFSNLTLSQAGSYDLQVISAGLSSADDIPITVTEPVTATQLIVTTEPPGSVAAGSAFSLAVSAEDGSGRVATSYDGPIVLVISTGTGALGGTTMLSALNGVATFSDLTLSPGGVYTIRATSDSLAPATTSPITVQAATSTALTASPTTANVGQTITLTAGVSGAAPTGMVTFFDGQTALGTAPLGADEQASLPVSTFGVGTHSIVAAYSGDDQNQPSSSTPPVTVTINGVATSTTLSGSAASSTVGQAVTFTAIIAGTSGTALPTGTVTFLDGTTTLGTGTLDSSGRATFTTSALAVGTHAITASYGGNPNFLASTSAPLTQQVSAGAGTGAGPTVTNLQRFGFHAQPTILILSFSTALDRTRAENPANYTVTGRSQQFTVTGAVYNPVSHTVTLMFRQLLNVHHQYTITVNGSAPNGLTSNTSVFLDGANTGKPGSNHVRTFGINILAGPASSAGLSMALVRKLSHHIHRLR